MYKYVLSLVLAACFFVVTIRPSYAVELIISDSGRNTAWSHQLNIGDDFSVKGADEKPVGGIMPNTTAIHQMLVPMPNKVELEQMSPVQEQNWVNSLGELLKDRVHIATTNGATIFEIRLLQNTPQPSAPTMPWQENPRTDRFTCMSYQAIGDLVEHLQGQNEPVRITAAFADSGSAGFAQSINCWKPYADIFRRVDLVDGRASLSEIRPVISSLGGKRVRLFHTVGVPTTPAMTIGRKEVAENLLNSYPYLTQYILTPTAAQEEASDQNAQTPWMAGLSGFRLYTVKYRLYVDGEAIEKTLTDELTGLEFRDPISGLDPQNLDFQSGASLQELGIIAPIEEVDRLPAFNKLVGAGATTQSITLAAASDYTFKKDLHGLLGAANEGKLKYSPDIATALKYDGDSFVPIDPTYKITDWNSYATGGNISDSLKQIEDNTQINSVNILCNGKTSCVDASRGVENFLSERPDTRIKINFNMLNRTATNLVDGIAEKDNPYENKNLLIRVDRLAGRENVIAANFEMRNTGRVQDLGNIRETEQYTNITTIYQDYGNRSEDSFIKPATKALLSKTPLLDVAKEVVKNVLTARSSDERVGGTHKKADFFKGTDSMEPIRGGPKTATEIVSEHMRFATKGSINSTKPLSKNNDHVSNNVLRIHSSELSDSVVKRIPSGTNIVINEPIRLDSSVKDILHDRAINQTLNPTGYKKLQPDDLVIEPRESFRLINSETPRDLGDITRNSGSRSFMQQGFDLYQKERFGDMPNFDRRSSSSSSIMRDGFKFNELPQPQFDSGRFDLSYTNKLPTPTNNDIGGVMLNNSAKVEGDGNTLNTGNVSLVFQNSEGVIDFMKLQRFSTALWATYLSVEGPGISIDPTSKEFKEHGDKHKVRYIGQVHNTELGKVMRETDYLMKRWAIGTHRPDIDNFLSPEEIDRKLTNKVISNRWSRFWFVPEGLTFKRSDQMLLFSGGRMTLQTEYLDDNPEGEKNEANELFAQWFTENYDLVAARYPIFQELFEYAQLVSLSTYLRENRVPMLWFLMANRELVLTENSISEVAQLVKKSGYKWYVKISGGVELQLSEALRNESSYETDPTLQDAEKVLRDNFSDNTTNNAPVVFSANDTSYTLASKNTLKLFSSPAQGDIIQTDLALVDEYHEEQPGEQAKDKKEWNLIAPRLELVRYYNPELRTRAQFGDGWHLLVPFRLETETQTPLSGMSIIPQRVVMVNLISGIREVLRLEEHRGVEQRYVPQEENGLTKSLIRYADGSWLLQDILGANFVFDQQGDLREMTLRGDNSIKFNLNSKKYNKRIPGYIVRYGYGTTKINGQDVKVLTSIKQGEHTARIDWHPDNTSPQIAAIRVLKQGQTGPVEMLDYEYNQDEMLAGITSKSGRNISFRYEDNNMQVAVAQK